MAIFSKSRTPQFSVEVYQNAYLPEGAQEVNAIVTVSSTGGGTGGRALPGRAGASAGTGVSPGVGRGVGPGAGDGADERAAVVIMVDCSGSMDYPPSKLRNVRQATAAAIDAIRDGVGFAVIAGTHLAQEVYPGDGRLATADAATRAAAKEALRRLTASGGTAIGTWLALADQLLGSSEASIRHGILLTDGRNEHEKPEQLRTVLEACAGHFTCDARGVGTDWEVKEVTSIASALLGSADIVADPDGLTADFSSMMESAMGKAVPDVALRLWTPQGAQVVFVKQVAPTVEDLTGRRTEAGPRTGDYPTGSWGDESRDYHVCVRVPPAGLGQEMLAARISLVPARQDAAAGTGAQQLLSQGLVRAIWTDDLATTTSVNPQVAHYTGQAELARAIQEGLALRKSGDEDGATAKLGRAVRLANEYGNRDTAKLLAKVVDVVDESAGTVRLRAGVADADEMTLETRSIRTIRVRK